MRVIFLIFVTLHGLIHLLGFVKAFDLREVKELTLPISKPIGIVWLIVTALFLLYAILYILSFKYAWLIGLITVIVSQILIIYVWKDAKFGTIPNVIILSVTLLSLGSYVMQSEFTSRVEKDFSENNTLSTDILTESNIAHLPAIVQKYLNYTKSVGQPKIKNFRAEFVGGMRSKPNDKYMKIQSVQYNFYQKPSRYFYMTASKMSLPATGLHLYQSETATFEVRLLNWFKVVDAKGDKMNQAETVTLLNDMCFIAPATLIDSRIKWEVINDTKVKAIFKNGSISISAILYFNTTGELVNFISNDRYDTDGKRYSNYPWATPVENYQMINGYLLPSKAKLIYQRPDGDFIYGELEYKSIKYNLNSLED
ncbi:DUF6544 family protein [Williamwhitmania taraxaci]|uniref:Uncharacterized protein n=1 Tax=Williamwhitmania taraxaci TaxID=1640674 RepID=A0A1G6GX94_9BACT|nr:DUF6544 family protein [Williamwhitmania taraxaci]SDB85756.1 hypothetical protein SAMN05216323_100449 [Williamwhitmania taraxaci]